MSFLGSFNPGKIVKNITKNPIKAASGAVLTGGISLVSPQVAKAVAPITSTLYNPQLLPVAASIATGGAPMGFNVGQFLGGVSGILGQSQIGSLQTLGQVAGLGAQFASFEQPTAYPVGNQQNLPVPAQPRGTVTMTKEIFDALNKMLGKLGIQPRSVSAFMSAAKRALGAIAAFARRTPAGTIVSVLIGLGLTAYEANLLTAWYSQKKKRRRMNPANSKALRRAARRIRSFHRLCQHTDVIKTHRSRRVISYGRRCGTCRKNPCAC